MSVDHASQSVGGAELRTFFAHQFGRLVLRLLIIAAGLISALFWTAVVLGAAYLAGIGLGALAFAIMVAWTIFSLPQMLVQVGLIFDLLWYVATGRTLLFPILNELNRFAHSVPTGNRKLLHTMTAVASATSPFSCLSLWAIVVLTRMPESAHVLRPEIAYSLREAIRRRRQAEGDVADVVLARLGLGHR
jgi:hypothetical protein